MAMDRESALLMMYRKELLHRDAFARFAEMEREPEGQEAAFRACG